MREKSGLVGRGTTADIYAYGEERVIKLLRAGYPASLAQQEYDILVEINKLRAPAPRVYSVLELEGRPGILLERIHGPSMMEKMTAYPWLSFGLVRQLAYMHSRIHTLPAGNLPPLTSPLYGAIASDAVPEAYRKAARTRLESLPGGDTLCHMDFRPDHVLMASNKTYVIDWLHACAGNPHADVCKTYLTFLLDMPEPDQPPMRRFTIGRMRQLLGRLYLQTYLRITGMRRSAVMAWMLPLAVARLAEGKPSEAELLHKIIKSEIR